MQMQCNLNGILKSASIGISEVVKSLLQNYYLLQFLKHTIHIYASIIKPIKLYRYMDFTIKMKDIGMIE